MRDTIETIKFVLEGVLLPTIGGLGLVGNLAAIAVLRSHAVDLKKSFCQVSPNLITFVLNYIWRTMTHAFIRMRCIKISHLNSCCLYIQKCHLYCLQIL